MIVQLYLFEKACNPGACSGRLTPHPEAHHVRRQEGIRVPAMQLLGREK